MAQKAAKTLAARNTSTLLSLHLVSLGVHALFITLRLLLFSRYATTARATYTLYLLLGLLPSLAIEAFFELQARPTYTALGDLKAPGADLEAQGVTEYLFDVLYWTWACIGLVAVVGNRAWWLWLAVPAYSVFVLWKAFAGVRGAMSGLAGGGGEGAGGEGSASASASGQSNRQKKLEKRGGQRVKYQ